MPEGPPPEALLILGMHRSGTSALARVVNLLGAQLGSRLLEPQTGVNAQGFWEHADVVSGHEALLGDLDSAWYDVRPLPVNWEDGAAAQRLEEHLARLLESDFSAHPLIAVKDPRLCRFVASWKRVLQRAGRRAKFVLILRDPEEVVRSLHRRDGLDQSTVRMMWLVYVLEAERATRDDPRSIVFYDELLTDWETTVDRIAGELDLRWPISTESARAQVEQELRSDLRHHVTSDVDRETADALAARCREVYDDLKNDPAGAGTLDPHWSWLAALRENSGELAEAMFRANQQFVARTAEWMLRTDEAQELQTQLDESRTRIRDLQVELARSIEERHALRQRQIDTEVAGGPPPIDVIVPVYRGLDELKRCLGSVLTQRQRVPYELVVVDDRSPEPEISAYLDELAARDMRVTLLRNETNLGFPATVNRGMSLHPGRDVVLLNSDTEVANDWLDRLARCARRADDIATVTPFTNNGTICSYPNFCRDNAPTAGMTTGEVDASFAAVNAGRAVEVPTAVGFCMYIRRACLDQVGMFDDKTFGAGYGEENEFCMRARRLGWKHLHCGDTFVFHSGAASFGLEKDMRVHAALEKLNAIHPQYKALVQRHIADDPAAGMRLAARIAITKRNRAPVVLFVSHREGGGTETHIRELSAYLHEQVQVIVLRPDAGRRVALSLGPESDSERLLFDLRSEYDELLTVCKALGVRRLHVHHVLGWPGKLHGLAGDLGVPLDVTVHDYYFINANPTLTDTRGRFCAAQRDRDRRCAEAYPIPGGATPQRWRAQQSELLRAADRVIAPSDYTALPPRPGAPRDLVPAAGAGDRRQGSPAGHGRRGAEPRQGGRPARGLCARCRPARPAAGLPAHRLRVPKVGSGRGRVRALSRRAASRAYQAGPASRDLVPRPVARDLQLLPQRRPDPPRSHHRARHRRLSGASGRPATHLDRAVGPRAPAVAGAVRSDQAGPGARQRCRLRLPGPDRVLHGARVGIPVPDRLRAARGPGAGTAGSGRDPPARRAVDTPPTARPPVPAGAGGARPECDTTCPRAGKGVAAGSPPCAGRGAAASQPPADRGASAQGIAQ
jgi:GT2 family glycosyltransferase